MKVKDLPKDTNLAGLPVRLPRAALDSFREYCGGEEVMRIVGNMMGDFFMGSLSRDEKGAQRLYPFPPEIDPSGILEWEVQEEENPTVAMKKSIVHARKRRKTQNQ